MTFNHPSARLFATREALSSVGRYGLRRAIGTSPSGTVYVGFDPETGREVAVNLMVCGRGESGARRCEEIVRVAHAWRHLAHPSIVQIHEIGTYENPLDGRLGVFIVRELVPGMDMQRWLDALTQPAHGVWGRVLDMFIESGEALAAAHGRGLVHRGVSPASLVVGYDGSVKLLDFGCAGAAPVSGGVSITSLAYSAPELSSRPSGAEWQSGVSPTALSDQYSFCASVFTALTRVLGERVPKRIAAVLTRGMAPQPEHRWPSMGELLHALHRNRGGLLRRTFASLYPPQSFVA
jgi:serine/threonine protein kinase